MYLSSALDDEENLILHPPSLREMLSLRNESTLRQVQQANKVHRRELHRLKNFSESSSLPCECRELYTSKLASKDDGTEMQGGPAKNNLQNKDVLLLGTLIPPRAPPLSHFYFPASGQALVSGVVPSSRYRCFQFLSCSTARRFSSNVANSRSRAFRESIHAQEVPTKLYQHALRGTRTYALDLALAGYKTTSSSRQGPPTYPDSPGSDPPKANASTTRLSKSERH